MPHAPYNWSPNGSPPLIKAHSITKHNVLRAYLVDYIQTLGSLPHQDELRLTLVDGFAGGGLYLHETTRQQVLGSPYMFLQAVQEAEAVVNSKRQKPLRMNVDYFFVESDLDAYDVLEKSLRDRGWGHRINKDINVVKGRFEEEIERITQFIRNKSPRNGRSIFLLDQYGYKDVPTPLVRSILSQLPAAEELY